MEPNSPRVSGYDATVTNDGLRLCNVMCVLPGRLPAWGPFPFLRPSLLLTAANQNLHIPVGLARSVAAGRVVTSASGSVRCVSRIASFSSIPGAAFASSSSALVKNPTRNPSRRNLQAQKKIWTPSWIISGWRCAEQNFSSSDHTPPLPVL